MTTTLQKAQPTQAHLIDDYFGSLVKHWVAKLGDVASPTRVGMDSMRIIAEVLPKVAQDNQCTPAATENLIKFIADTLGELTINVRELTMASHRYFDPLTGAGLPIQVTVDVSLPNTAAQATQLAIWSLAKLKEQGSDQSPTPRLHADD